MENNRQPQTPSASATAAAAAAAEPSAPDRKTFEPAREIASIESPEPSSRGRSTETRRTIATTGASSTLIDSLWSGSSSIAALNREQFHQPLASPSHLSHFRSRFRHRVAKSTSSQTSVSSQPVLVRAYTGSRQSSRPQSVQSMTVPFMGADTKLPPIEAFTFDGILRAVEPEIQDALDAIAEICARSRMSLANEHSAHMPPQGEILAAGMPSPSLRLRQHGLAIRTTGLDNTLTAVPEASSSSEHLAGGSKASSRSGQGKVTAYGSLKSIITRSLSQDQPSGAAGKRSEHKRAVSWAILDGSTTHAAIILASPAAASNQLSLESAPPAVPSLEPAPEHDSGHPAAWPSTAPKGPDFGISPTTSWLIRRRQRSLTAAAAVIERPRTGAESSLKDLLRASPVSGHG